MTNSNLAGSGEKPDTQPFRDSEQINNLDQELESADSEFRKAAEAGDAAGMVAAHSRLCQGIAKLSTFLSDTGKPVIFARYHVVPEFAATAAATPAAVVAPPASASFVSTTELERQIASLAQQMQKCLEAGDMDGMLKCNEKMGELSEVIARQEMAMRENAAPAADPLAKLSEAAGIKDSKSGGWSAGDTLALARQRAEERKKQLKQTPDTFDIVAGTEPAAAVDMMAADSKPASQDELRERLEQCNFYEILSMPSSASFEELHRSFLRKIRKLNKRLLTKELEDWQFQEFVGALCLAHDVLKYPSARMQYDLTLFGSGEVSPEATAKQKLMPLKELLRFSTLVSILDLMDAGDAAEGKHEREMGFFLINKGTITQEEFDSMLFAQKLVSSGKLTLAQFELAMQEMRESNIPLLDTLIASEWIQPSDVLSADSM